MFHPLRYVLLQSRQVGVVAVVNTTLAVPRDGLTRVRERPYPDAVDLLDVAGLYSEHDVLPPVQTVVQNRTTVGGGNDCIFAPIQS
ncbi:hypothetical protein A3709_09210 [Halioglobus sp. HI00S01]|nr:hypothetical protein A3709_09210 [Halioglobus sp. HI00S01]